MCSGGCNGSGNNCSCDCSTIVLPQNVGPTGPTGPAGTTIIFWDTTSYSTVNTGVDVLLLSTTISLANTLSSNGSEYQFEITGTCSDNADRAVKIDLNASSITTVMNNSGVLADGRFVINGVITRVSSTSTEGFNQASWNLGGSQQLLPATNSFVPDFTTTNSFRVYVNQSVASSITITSIKIRRAIL
jgi:hypothetical protein